MKKNLILSTLFALFFGLGSFAQGGGIWNFDWNIGFGTGETANFVSAPSFRGFSIEGRGFVTDKITLGGFAGWNTFYESEGNITRDFGQTGTVNGYNRKYINAFPVLVTAHYYFAQTTVMPYAGIGVGGMYAESRDFMGIYYIQDKDWHFALAPEVGIVLPFGNSNSGIHAGVKYNWGAKTRNTDAISYMTLNIGISYIF